MSNTDVHTASSEKTEVVEVKDPSYGKPHFLLLVTKESSLLQKVDGDLRWSNAKMEVTARYLYGPLPRLIGQLVCDMGGSTSDQQSVRITNGEVMVRLDELRGLHIGSFMFGRVVGWAKALAPTHRIVPIRLSLVDAHNPANKDRRNKLYENFGIKFEYRAADGITKAEGSSVEGLLVRDLVEYKGWTNITTSHWMDGFQELARANMDLREAARRNRVKARHYGKVHNTFVKRIAFLASHLNRVTLLITGGLGYAVGKFGLAGIWALLTAR